LEYETHLFYLGQIEKGRQAAITATARKIAVILYNMIIKGEQYQPKTAYVFLDEKRKQILQSEGKLLNLN
jgi:hypothetical protein